MMSTNIKISGNKVIFDGHASNDRECKTITNICNALKDSDSFETKEYKSGYAEFESVTEPEKKLFGEEPGSVTINFDSHVRKVTCGYGTYTKSGQTISDDYMFNYCTFRVYCDDGYIIDTVTSDRSEHWAKDITEYTFYGTGDSSSFISGPTFTITTKQSTATTKYKAERMYGDSELQDSVTVTPTTSNQTVTLDSDKIAVKSVKVNKIPSNYIVPSGTLEITENGETNVKNYEKVNVNVETNDGVALTAASSDSFASLLTADNEGKIVKYTGTTSEDYVAGEYYLIIDTTPVYKITLDFTYIDALDDNPTTIKQGEEVTIWYNLSGCDGISKPEIVGADLVSWAANIGGDCYIKINNATGDVTIKAEGYWEGDND